VQARTFERAGEFLARVQTSLEREETANSLLLGIALSLKEPGEPLQAPPLFLVVEENKAPRAAVVMTPPRGVVLWADDTACIDAMACAARRIHADGWATSGALGRTGPAKAFAEAWTRVSGQPHREKARLRVHELRRVNRVQSAPGRARFATHEDLEVAAGWVAAFRAEATGEFVNLDQARQWTAPRIEHRDVLLWEDGQAVSMAARVRPTAHSTSIGYVYTPPEFRRRGYATSCVAALTQRVLDSGREFCCLFTDLANPTSNSIYRKIGYLPVCDWAEYVFGA